MKDKNVLSRLIRMRDAPTYVGMDRHRFNKEVRPCVTLIPIGIQGVAFDRLDLDAWIDDYKQRSGRPTVTNSRSIELWDENKRQACTKGARSGTYKSKSSGIAFEKALELSYSQKRSAISRGDAKK